MTVFTHVASRARPPRRLGNRTSSQGRRRPTRGGRRGGILQVLRLARRRGTQKHRGMGTVETRQATPSWEKEPPHRRRFVVAIFQSSSPCGARDARASIRTEPALQGQQEGPGAAHGHQQRHQGRRGLRQQPRQSSSPRANRRVDRHPDGDPVHVRQSQRAASPSHNRTEADAEAATSRGGPGKTGPKWAKAQPTLLETVERVLPLLALLAELLHALFQLPARLLGPDAAVALLLDGLQAVAHRASLLA